MTKYIQSGELLKNEYGQRMRQKPTAGEQAGWALLHQWKLASRFTRQKYIGGFLADFYSPYTPSTVIEVDGKSHQGREDYDRERDEIFRQKGITTVRVTNEEVLHHPDVARARIFACLGIEPPSENTGQEVFQGIKYRFNPYGERVNVSFTLNGQSFRNSIKTRGATSFDKNLFLRDAGKIFACQRFTNVSLVIAEATRAYKQIMFCDGGQVFPETQKVKGFILTKTGHRLGFALDGILTSTKPHNIIEFLNSACRFQPELSPLSVVIGSNHSSPFRVELPGKYISECVISHQTPGGVTSFSTLYADARRFQSESVIEQYESLISGKIISISRKLAIPTDVYDEPRDPHHTKIIQASGRAMFQHRLSSLWKLEGVDDRCWKRLPELGKTMPEPAIQWFLEKHMILSDETGEAAHPDQVIVSRLSQ